MDQEDPNQVKLTIFTFFMELSLAQINKMWFFYVEVLNLLKCNNPLYMTRPAGCFFVSNSVNNFLEI